MGKPPVGFKDDLDLAEPLIAARHDDWDRRDFKDELETFLREAGTPEELRLREERLVFEFSEILRTVPPDAISEEQTFFVQETMTLMREHLTKLREQAEWAVAMLSREGFRFDRVRDRLIPMDDLSSLKRRRFADDVLAIFRSEVNRGNTRRVRVRIAEELQGSYPPEMLSPRAYFPIWQCIEDHLKPAG
jgi:hypothetical protein